MEQMFDIENEQTKEPTIEPETVEEAEDMEDEKLINAMFGLEEEPEVEEDNNVEEENNNVEEKNNNIEEEPTVENVQKEDNEESELNTNEGQEQGGTEEEKPVENLIEDLLSDAEKIGGEEVDAAAQEVQDAIDEGAPQDEILQKLAELEEALANETLTNETLSKEKEQLIQRISELQDKLAEYEMKSYEYGTIEKALEEDPSLKWFVKILAYYKLDPNKVGKERLISALDNLTQSEFGVSIKSLLDQKAKEENKKMTMGEEKTPIEINVSTDTENPIEDMFDI